MATKKLMLNKARRLNDGTYPLVMQMIHRRKKRVIYSGIYLYPQEFDRETEKVVPCREFYRYPKDIRLKNNAIDEFVLRVDSAIAMLIAGGRPYTCDEIAELYHIGHDNASLTFHWQTKIAEYRRMQRFGIADAQQSTLKSVVYYAGSPYVGMARITPEFVRSYERSLLDRGVSPNTVCYYMRNFKTILNGIAKERLIRYKVNVLFDGIRTSPRKTVKRAIARDELRALAQMTFKDEPILELARDLFMFSFYTRGMSFVDIAFLSRENVSGNYIRYSRRKTKQYLQVSISQPIRALIEKYEGDSQFLFPVVSSENAVLAYKTYRSTLRRMNKALKIIGERLGMRVGLTTYVARHSWATQAKEQGFPVSVISEGLGHSSENVTQIYLKEFDHRVLDRANDVITSL